MTVASDAVGVPSGVAVLLGLGTIGGIVTSLWGPERADAGKLRVAGGTTA
jgi:hypothetical protein